MGGLVSIVMPAHNAQRFVGQAIASVLQQTWRDWELVVVDDGSTDGTAEAARDAALGDERVKVLRREHAAGPGAARNTALAATTGGEFLAFLDADDWYEPDRLARCVAVLGRNPECAFMFHDLWLVDEEGRRQAESYLGRARFLEGARAFLARAADGVWLLKPDYLTFMCLRYCAMITSGSLFRRAAFDAVGGLFDESLRAGEDIDVWFRLAKDYRGAYLDECLASYRQYDGSLTTRTERYLRDTVTVHKRNLARLGPVLGAGVRAAYRKKIARHRGYLAWHYVQHGQWKKALAEYARGIAQERAWRLTWPLVKCLARAVTGRLPSPDTERA